MQLKELDPSLLKPNPWNSNKVSKTEFEKLKKSLTRYGAFKPVVVRELKDGSLQIIGGYHRCEAAKALGWTKIPVVNLGAIDDDQAKEIGLIDNTRYGEDDKELLDKLLSELGDLSALESIMPEEVLADLETEDTLLEALETEKTAASDEEKPETHKTLKMKLEIDKYDEIETILLRVAGDHDYKYSDGYSNLGDALYHILVLEK
jgi:ParB-like chromosome segregation protein Spo0J